MPFLSYAPSSLISDKSRFDKGQRAAHNKVIFKITDANAGFDYEQVYFNERVIQT